MVEKRSFQLPLFPEANAPVTGVYVDVPQCCFEKKWISGNMIAHLRHPRRRLSVTVSMGDDGALLLRDEQGKELRVYSPRMTIEPGKAMFALKSDVRLCHPIELGPAVNLRWVKPSLPPPTPNEIVASWKDAFSFYREGADGRTRGLRDAQLGALHSIASHWTVSIDTATVVMPTGTGKTETMMGAMVLNQCEHVLVVVPSDALRKQTCEKFAELGCLMDIGAISRKALYPRVALLRKRLSSVADARDLVSNSNVVVATAQALAAADEAIRKEIASQCTHLFIDEAHHVAAPTWERIRNDFAGKPVLQFTATPFRRDGKRVDGTIIFNYPLSMAQKAGYFRSIGLVTVEELDERSSDQAIAKAAIRRLKEDRARGLDHLILARTDSIRRALSVLKVYRQEGARFDPVMVHSGSSQSDREACLGKLRSRDSRVLICVDMFGEGFDLPNLKIAAMHDVHKSLAITLQFVGRFVRSASQVGDASVVVNTLDPDVPRELQSLYAQDADWNSLLNRHSEGRVSKEVTLQELILSFSGELPKEVPLWNLHPGFSTMVFRTTCDDWTPEAIGEALPTCERAWTGVSAEKQMAIAVIARRDDVRWGRYRNIKDQNWHLIIARWDAAQQLLFIYASNYQVFKITDIAVAVSGGTAIPVVGTAVFRVFGGVERPMVQNLGASKAGTIRYTMYFGPDVAVGLSHVEKAESALSNLFGWGYEGGDKVNFGCSARRGKIWSADAGTVSEWSAWSARVGMKVLNAGIDDLDIVRGFLRPSELTERPEKVPIAAGWGESIMTATEESTTVFFGNEGRRLFDVGIGIDRPSATGAIRVCITCDNRRSVYELQFGALSGNVADGYRRIEGPQIHVQIGRGQKRKFEEHMIHDPIVVQYADGSFSYNNFYVDAPLVGSFPEQSLAVWTWEGVNITVESEGPDQRGDSIQKRVIGRFADNYDVVFNDDGSGEAADVIALRQLDNGTVLLHLIHCKYSASPDPGARVEDLYELCGQAQKSARWKHRGLHDLVLHMKHREAKWRDAGNSRFRKGDASVLSRLLKVSQYSSLAFEATVVQPGLSKRLVSQDMRSLLGSTDLYLKKTADATLHVVCSI